MKLLLIVGGSGRGGRPVPARHARAATRRFFARQYPLLLALNAALAALLAGAGRLPARRAWRAAIARAYSARA